jgi:hypothetical protein
MIASATSTRTRIPIERSGAWQPHAECRSRASAQDDGVGDVEVKGKLVIARRCFRCFDHSTAGQDGLLKSARKLKAKRKDIKLRSQYKQSGNAEKESASVKTEYGKEGGGGGWGGGGVVVVVVVVVSAVHHSR